MSNFKNGDSYGEDFPSGGFRNIVSGNRGVLEERVRLTEPVISHGKEHNYAYIIPSKRMTIKEKGNCYQIIDGKIKNSKGNTVGRVKIRIEGEGPSQRYVPETMYSKGPRIILSHRRLVDR